jgi:hypothetical protein
MALFRKCRTCGKVYSPMKVEDGGPLALLPVPADARAGGPGPKQSGAGQLVKGKRGKGSLMEEGRERGKEGLGKVSRLERIDFLLGDSIRQLTETVGPGNQLVDRREMGRAFIGVLLALRRTIVDVLLGKEDDGAIVTLSSMGGLGILAGALLYLHVNALRQFRELAAERGGFLRAIRPSWTR